MSPAGKKLVSRQYETAGIHARKKDGLPRKNKKKSNPRQDNDRIPFHLLHIISAKLGQCRCKSNSKKKFPACFPGNFIANWNMVQFEPGGVTVNQFVCVLTESFLFSDLPEEVIRNEILPHGVLLDVPKKQYLIRFQDLCETFGIVIKGKLNLLHIYGNGDFSVMDVLQGADIFGLDLICTGRGVSPYYAVAMQDTQVLSFPAKLILTPGMLPEALRQQILPKVMKYIANENVRKEYRLAILYQNGLRDRIMTYLTMQANQRKSDTFTIPFSREEMASYLCVNRSCLSHELSLMEKEGILRFHRNEFTLLNRNENMTHD